MQFYSPDEFSERLQKELINYLGEDFRELEAVAYLDDDNVKKLALYGQGIRREDLKEIEVSSAYAQFRRSSMELEDFLAVLAETYKGTGRDTAAEEEKDSAAGQEKAVPVSERLFLYLSHYDAERLTGFPHIKKGSLALLCLLEEENGKTGSPAPSGVRYTAVSENMAKDLGISRERLLEEARDNSRQTYTSILQRAADIPGWARPACLPDIHVFSNASGFCGSAVLFYDADAFLNLLRERDGIVAVGAFGVLVIPADTEEELKRYEQVFSEMAGVQEEADSTEEFQVMTYRHMERRFICRDGSEFPAGGI